MGDELQQKESAFAHKAVVERLKAQRDKIATLPIEKQFDVYSVAFDRFAKPQYSKLGLKDKELELAKDKWITGVLGGEGQKPFPEGFGEGKATDQFPRLEGFAAGIAGGSKNVIDWYNDFIKSVDPKSPLLSKGETPERKFLSEVEGEKYARAKKADPEKAAFAAGVGKQVPALAAFELGAGTIPAAAKGAPLAWRLLSRLGKTAVGTAAMSTTEEKPTLKETATQAGINIALDALFRGLGKAGAKGAARIISKVSAKGTPAQQQAAKVVDDLLTTVLKDKFGGKPLDQLTSAEFDAATKEASIRRATIEQQAKEAKKAVAQAKVATKRSPEQKVIDREALKASKAAETKAKNERAKAFHKRLVDYKARMGSIPPPESQHMKDLIGGKTADEILGPKPEVAAVQAATGVAEAHEAQAIQEGAPQAVAAVEAIRSVAPERRGVPGKSPTGIERRDPLPEQRRLLTYYKTKLAQATTEHEKMVLQAQIDDLKGTEGAFKIGGGGEEVAKNIHEATKKAPMFKMNIDKVLNATSPQDFARAKKEAMDDIVTQARERAKTAPESEKMKIVSEANKAREKIRSLEVPKTFAKKTLDAARKAEEAKGTAGSVAVEEVSSSASTVTSSSDPEVEMLRQEQLTDQLLEIATTGAYDRVIAAIKGKDLKLQNDMLEAAIEALKKVKK